MTTTLEKSTQEENVAVAFDASDQLSPEQLSMDLPLTERETDQLTRCEAVIQEGMETFWKVGTALSNIRDSRLYRRTHRTFEDYCQERWDIKKSSAYRLMGAVDVINNLASNNVHQDENSPIGETPRSGVLPENEAQVRPLTTLPADQQPVAWERAQEIARESDQPITAGVVQQAVDEIKPPKPAVKVEAPQDALFDSPREAGPGSAKFAEPGTLTPGGDNAGREGSDADDWEAGYDGKGEVASPNEDAPALPPSVPAPVNPPAAPAAKPAPVATAKAAPQSQTAAQQAQAAPPTLPEGWTTAMVKTADLAAAQVAGLWPLAQALETLAEARAQSPPQEVPLAAPPSIAMALAGSAATRLAEINATSGTILYTSETQVLDELFPQRETTGPDHIVAVLLTARLREMTAKDRGDTE
jgi:hypothetical protein